MLKRAHYVLGKYRRTGKNKDEMKQRNYFFKLHGWFGTDV